MIRKDFSPMQNFTVELIERVGCISVYQLYYICFKMCNAKPSVVKYMLHDFVSKGICHFDSQEQYVAAGKSVKDELHKFNKSTIYGIAVALSIITNPQDFRTIYRPYSGEDIRFMANNHSYGVLVTKEDNITKLLFYQNMYTDFMRQATKNHIKEDLANEAYQTLLITYPLKADVKTAFKSVESLELTMPHALCFTESDKGIFDEIRIKMVGIEAE